MFDFAVDNRNEGSQPGLNDKGLVTRDRKTRKDTFHFYKANWNPEPMLYLASRRMTPRKQTATEVKACSNCVEVELKLNGKSLGTKKPDDIKVVRWSAVTLRPGRNSVEVIGRAGGKTIADQCEWVLEEKADSSPDKATPSQR
jgi:beta-galactosidase